MNTIRGHFVPPDLDDRLGERLKQGRRDGAKGGS